MRSAITVIFAISMFVLPAFAQDKTGETTPGVRPARPGPESKQAGTRSEIIPDTVPVDRANTDGQQNGWYTRPDGKTRSKRYFNSMFGPTALARNVASAGIATWRNSPEEWGPHWEGFGRRVASGVGRSVIKNSVMYGLDEVLEVDSHYYRSRKKDAGSRIVNAVISPVTARRPDGKRTIGVPRLVGTYTGSIVAAETWYPDRYDYKDGLRSGTISLGFTAAFNLFKEFVWKK